MWTIFKYPLVQGEDIHDIQMPEGAEILSVQLQNGVFTLWAKVESGRPLVFFRVHIIGTGQPANFSRSAYVSTVQIPPYVFHVFAYPLTKQ